VVHCAVYEVGRLADRAMVPRPMPMMVPVIMSGMLRKEKIVSANLANIVWPQHTERLTLRPVADADLPRIWSYRRLVSVSRWVSRSINDYEAFHAFYGAPRKMSEMVVLEHRGRVIGDLMVRVSDAWGQDEIADKAQATQAELAWCLDPAYARQGLATEAIEAQIRLCFEDLGLRRVVASCFAANEPSWRLMQQVGMRREAHRRRDALHRDGNWYDTFDYALLSDE